MVNRISEANDALWAALQVGFGDAVSTLRNPKSDRAPATATTPAIYVVQQDGVAPEVLRVLCGPIFDLKLEARVNFLQLGDEPDRRDRRSEAIGELAEILQQDPTLGGAVDYARLDVPEAGDPDQLHWLADALTLPVLMLLSAPTPAG